MASFVRIRCSDNVFRHLNFYKTICKRNEWPKVCSLHTSSAKYVIELKMPSLSPTMAEGTIVSWHKREGEAISPGDVLCEIQTDKAVMAFETEEEGVLAKILMGDDSKDVKVGSLIALLAEPGEDWKGVQIPAASGSSGAITKQPSTAQSVTEEISKAGHASPKRSSVMGPAVRSLLERYGLSATTISGSGPHGILLKGDVLKFIAKENLTPKPVAQVAKPSSPSPQHSGSPATSKSPGPKAVKKIQSLSNEQEFQDVDLSNMRRTIAKRLTQSKTGIPHAYSTVSCKMDAVLEFRKKSKAEGINFSINDVIIKAVATALSSCPEVNVVWKGDELIHPNSIDVSVAVATDSGLITPIVTDVPLRGVQEISKIVRDLADRARLGKLQLHEFQGGSFTISNLGMYGISEFSAIINPPQCAILAVGGSRLVLGEDGKPETMMSATLSYDNEAVSDTAAANFMSTLQSLLESPKNLLFGRRV